ncbi:hypothetical protein DYB32_009230 [Aphanomyces invadans]|uniref:Uncharacterized protein n=1 Tax=Aphanomyces invadans TaxID=157072 RepID=A0A3R6WFN8_9STRA|nr:hypothetical protein DYB32_009230 [Aphanomyces invadans]
MKMEPGITDEIVDDMEAQWANGQTALTKLGATSCIHHILKDAGHDIPHEKPDAVAKAIVAVLDDAHGDATNGLQSLKVME